MNAICVVRGFYSKEVTSLLVCGNITTSVSKLYNYLQNCFKITLSLSSLLIFVLNLMGVGSSSDRLLLASAKL